MSVETLVQLVQEQGVLIVGTAALAAISAVAFWIASGGRLKPIDYPVGLDDQSVEIEPGVRASKFAADGKLFEYMYEDSQTTHAALVRGLRLSKNGPCIGRRKPGSKSCDWVSYQEIYDRAQQLGSALVHLGLKPNDETFIGIYASNCVEWVVSEEACSMYSMVIVPLYDTLGVEACEFIINQTEMSVVICDTASKAKLLFSTGKSIPSLKHLVIIDGKTLMKEIIKEGLDRGITVCSFDDMLKTGSTNLLPPVPPKPETICTLCYTSGTTGNPKGVILSHKAMIACMSGAIKHYQGYLDLTTEDVHFSYLPLAHMYERLNQLFLLQNGGKIALSSGDTRLLLEDIAIIRPTMFPTVPRVLNRLYDKIHQSVSSSWIKSTLFRVALQRKTALLQRGIVTKSTIWDWLVFGRIQKLMGGRLQYICVGSAPISHEVLTTMRCVMGCLVYEGYGQTEVTAMIAMTLPQEYTTGHVGAPLPTCHIKLVDIPDMDYYAKNGRGEVCIRSAAVMNGYYKDPEKTREVIDEEGWVHSGDVGEFLPNGTLKLIDRKKHIFKLAQGEYVAPEKVESFYIRSPFVAQVFVEGDSLQTFPVAIVIPDVDYLPGWAKNSLGITDSMEDLCRNKAVKEAILKDLIEKGKEGGLKGFEQVKAVHLNTQLFTVENGLMTPSLKTKRPAVRKRYEVTIQELYRNYTGSV